MSVPYTRKEVLAEIARELAMRRNLYPRWVQNGTLTKEKGDAQIARMQVAYDFIMEHWPASETSKEFIT